MILLTPIAVRITADLSGRLIQTNTEHTRFVQRRKKPKSSCLLELVINTTPASACFHWLKNTQINVLFLMEMIKYYHLFQGCMWDSRETYGKRTLIEPLFTCAYSKTIQLYQHQLIITVHYFFGSKAILRMRWCKKNSWNYTLSEDLQRWTFSPM